VRYVEMDGEAILRAAERAVGMEGLIIILIRMK